MILRDFYLYPELTEYAHDTTVPFRNQSRSICNYLGRQIKTLKYGSAGFRRICFIGSSHPNPECTINSSNVLSVEIPFDESEFHSIQKIELNRYFGKMIETGIDKC